MCDNDIIYRRYTLFCYNNDMKQDRFKLIAGVFLLLEKDNKIFLIRRKNTGWEDGKYAIVGGHLNGNEKASIAAVREAQEEIGVKIKPNDLTLFNIMHIQSNSERINLAFVTKKWEGEPKNNEPEKCDQAKWFSLNKLPENLEYASKEVIACYKNNIFYIELGWDQKPDLIIK